MSPSVTWGTNQSTRFEPCPISPQYSWLSALPPKLRGQRVERGQWQGLRNCVFL